MFVGGAETFDLTPLILGVLINGVGK